MFGYNIADWDQIGLMGEELDAGRPEPPAVRPARPRSRTGCVNRNSRRSANCECRPRTTSPRAFALKFGYTGSVHRQHPPGGTVGRLRCRTWATSIPAARTILINGFDLGVEFVH